MDLLFGKYTITEELDHGSLFRAKDDRNNDVILKIVDHHNNTVEEIEYITREFSIVSSLNRYIPEVVEAIEVVNDGNKTCCVYDYISGLNLYDYRSLNQENPAFWTELLKKTVIALGKVHQHNTLHKDISPYNLIYTKESQAVTIIDFGLANTIDMETGAPAYLMGNPQFVSPEQTGRISRGIDIRSDFYSLGMTFYYCYSGVLPFESSDISSLIYSQIATVPKPLTEYGISKPVSDVISKLIAKNPEERYQSLHGLLYDVNIVLEILYGTYKNPVFVAGEEDHNPNRGFSPVFGRESELNYLTNIFEKSIGGSRKVVFLAGPSGMGKTSLVNEFKRKVALYKGLFLEGKFEQFNRDTPYAALSSAIINFLKRCKLEDPTRFHTILHRIKSTLGGNLGLAMKVFPGIKNFFSEDHLITSELYTEYDKRVVAIIVELLQAISVDNEPILLFIDNMQWCNDSSNNLFKRLVEYSDLTDLMIIFSYRKGGYEFLLEDIVEEYGENPDFFLIQLQALSHDAVSDILQNRFNIENLKVHSLTTYFMSKTRGNPLLIEQVLKTLLRKNMFRFNSISGEWEWSLSEIEQCDISESIGDLLKNELELLSPSKQKLLEIASCIGLEFSLRELTLFDIKELRSDLTDMILQGYILPMDMNYRLLNYNNINLESIGAGKPVKFRFQHPSIHKVVYDRLNDKEKEEIHFILARDIMDDDKRGADSIIQCAIHLQSSIKRIGSEILTDVLTIFNSAAELSIQHGAYEIALDFTVNAKDLMGEKTDFDYLLIRSLYINLMKTYYLTGDINNAETIADKIEYISRNNIERAELFRVQMSYYKHLGQLHKSIEKGYLALKQLNYSFPESVTSWHLISSLIPLKVKLSKFSINDLFYMNEGSRSEIALIISVLGEFIVPAFITGESNLFALACIKQVELTLKHGTYNESAHAYSNLAILMSGMGDYKKGYELSNLAIKLVEANICTYMSEMIYSSRAVFNTCWVESWESLTHISKKGMEVSLSKGEQFFLSHQYSYVGQWDAMESIPSLLEQGEPYLKKFDEISNFGAEVAFKLLYQRWLNLSGKLESSSSLDSKDFNSKTLLEELKEKNFVSGIVLYHLHMMIVLYHNGDIEGGLEHYARAKSEIHALAGGAYMFEFVLYGFLLIAKSLEYRGKNTRKSIKELKNLSKTMRRWAKINIHNFRHFDLVFRGEIARITGRTNQARKLYTKTMNALELVPYVRDKAIVLELVSHFYISRGETSIGLYVLHDAYRAYFTWGACKKATEIINRLSSIGVAEKFLLYSKPGNNPGTTQLNSNQLIDLVSLIKVSQALSGELNIDKLLNKVVMEVSKNMGAEKTYYIHRDNEEWVLYSESKKINMLVATSLSHGVIDYVTESGKVLYLDNACQSGDFVNEKYIKANGIKSVFCYPVKKKSEVVGLWYLENNLITGAFTTAREEILSILSSQLAISIENARVYKELESVNRDLEIKVEERTEELVELNSRLEKLSVTDALTGLFNRYKFDELLNYETQRVNRTNGGLSMILIDVDHFKRINDSYGHIVGDDVLVLLAKDLQSFLRNTDSIARWGGEEFVILLPETPLQKAEHVAEQIRATIARSHSYPSGRITISLGVVEYEKGESLRSLVEKADLALYEAKSSGRNVVKTYKRQNLS